MPPSKLLIASALALNLAACASTGQTPIPLTDGGAIGAFKPIPNSSRAPCETQKAIARHNSVYDTLKSKRLVEYRAPCEGAPKQVAVNG